MKYNHKVRASSIQYAIITVLLIAFLLGGLVLYAGATSKLQVRFELQERMRSNVMSALEYGKSINQELEYDQIIKVNLFESEIDEITLTKKNWGTYDYLSAEAMHPQFRASRTEMIGSYNSTKTYALYLTDGGSGLALCGKTSIVGRVALPQKGVKRAYIAGQNFEGDQLIDGTIEKSTKNLPEINQKYLNQIQKPLLSEKLKWSSFDSLHQSFEQEAKYFFSEQPLAINQTKISGQVIIESTDSIFVSRTAELEDVIVKAPIIYIEKGFNGSAQFIASHRIVVAENVVLRYPSVLALLENREFEEASTIVFKDGSKVLGSVFLHSSINNFRKPVFLDIEKGVEIHGFAYCQGTTQLKGLVSGSLVTNKFYLKTQSSSYENHLLNANISSAIPDQFCIVPLLKNNYKTTAIKCLN